MIEQRYLFFIWCKLFLTFFSGNVAIGAVASVEESSPLERSVSPNRPVWGFYAHRQINRLAVFTLPAEMGTFFKRNIQWLADNAVNPDRRRYAVADEAPRHYIDLDAYTDTSIATLPRAYTIAAERYGADTLALHGIVPWHIQLAKFQLTDAFRQHDARRVLRLCADLGHYIADANVPLHTTRNYNGQLTGQTGIHAFWESRVPELFAGQYDFFVGPAEYVASPQKRAWQAVFTAHAAVDSVLRIERELTEQLGERGKWAIEDRNGVMLKTYSEAFARQYQARLAGQVERQMRASVKMVGDFWFTCWVDAGQPDLSTWTNATSSADVAADEKEKQSWLKRLFSARPEN